MKKLIALICAVAGMLVLVMWQLFSADTNYYLITVIILILSMLPFFVSFEKSRPSARELTLIAVDSIVDIVATAVVMMDF